MNITVEKLYPRPSRDYPYNCRVALDKCTLRQYDDVLAWTVQAEIPCTWTGDWAVYMDDKNATLLMLRWS